MLEGRSKQDDQVTRSRWDLLDHLMYLIFETGHLKSVYEATNKDSTQDKDWNLLECKPESEQRSEHHAVCAQPLTVLSAALCHFTVT